jgi:trigger factor
LSTADTQQDCRREVTVEVPADVVAHETESVVAKLQKLARLPGFRKGKVPAGIIRTRFADDVRHEVIESLVPKHLREELDKQNLAPVSQPQVSDLHLHEGEPLRFKASFEVMPAIEVAGYEEIRADKPEIAVSDDDVEKALENVRQQQATFSPVEGRALENGDFAQVSLKGMEAGGTGQPVNVDDVMVEIGGSNTLAEFTENLRGVSPGEERTFDVRYPDEFSDQRLAGKSFRYTVSVKSIKRKDVPELNDDFAKQVGEFQTVDDLRHRIREQMEAERRHTAEHEAKEKLVDELVRRHDFPVPEALVEHQIDLRLERGLRALAAQGMRQEDMKKMDFGRLRAGQREQALKEVKAALILETIADAEKVEVTDEEIDREVQALAKQTQQTAEAIRARLTRDGALDRIRNRIRNEKTLELLYSRSA